MSSVPTARARRLADVCATVVLKYCSMRFRPPKKKHMPRTKSKFERIDPISEVCTIRILSWKSAMTETINSTALPKLALRRPPRVSPTLEQVC